MVGRAFLRPAGRSAMRRERISCRNHNAPSPLGDHRAEGCAFEAQPDDEDEERVDHQVDHIDSHRDPERGPCVLVPAKGAVPRGHQEHGRRSYPPYPQIGDGGSRYFLTGAHQADEPWGQDFDHDGRDEAKEHGEHEGVADPPSCLRLVPTTERLSHQRRCRVGEEVEPEEDESEDCGIDAQRRQLVDPNPRHEGGVDESQERVYRQGPQRRDGEPENGPIGDSGVGHRRGVLWAKANRSGNSQRSNSSHCPHNGRLASHTSRPNWMILIDSPDHSAFG